MAADSPLVGTVLVVGFCCWWAEAVPSVGPLVRFDPAVSAKDKRAIENGSVRCFEESWDESASQCLASIHLPPSNPNLFSPSSQCLLFVVFLGGDVSTAAAAAVLWPHPIVPADTCYG